MSQPPKKTPVAAPSSKPTAPEAAGPGKSERGLNFGSGVALSAMTENVPHKGFVGDDDVVGVRQGEAVFVVGSKCSHYGAPMDQGRVDGERLMCPWHHACFSLRDGATLKAPGLAPLKSYPTKVTHGKAVAQAAAPLCRRDGVKAAPKSVTVVGAGPAALSAVAELRQQGYNGPIHVFGAEPTGPYDRTKLSKAFLGGQAKAKSLPINADFLAGYAGLGAAAIQWHLGIRVEKVLAESRELVLQDGSKHGYDALLLACGASAKLPGIAGDDQGHVHLLRSLQDAEALKAAVDGAKQVLIVGASFIGLEAASALRQQGVEVTVIARDEAPMQKVLGQDVGQTLFHLHQSKGVKFSVGQGVRAIAKDHVVLDNGDKLAAKVVLLATGVVPATKLAEAAGLACDNGIVVDAQLRASKANVWAAGDVASFPWAKDGKQLRIEHWSWAEQMGRVAARNILGQQVALNDVPFFWTEHFGMKVRYVGHTRKLQHNETFGDLEKGRAAVALYEGERIGAVLTVGCDDVSMACEAALAAGKEQEILPLLRKV